MNQQLLPFKQLSYFNSSKNLLNVQGIGKVLVNETLMGVKLVLVTQITCQFTLFCWHHIIREYSYATGLSMNNICNVPNICKTAVYHNIHENRFNNDKFR